MPIKALFRPVARLTENPLVPDRAGCPVDTAWDGLVVHESHQSF